MRILSFDTSTGALHLSLLESRQPVWEHIIEPADNRSQVASALMPVIDQCCRSLNWRKNEIDLLVVGIGPGSFTGIRVAVITARTLAQALALPLIGVSALERIYAGSGSSDPAGVVLATTSEQYFYGAYEQRQGVGIAPVIEPGCGNASIVMERLAGFACCYADQTACQKLTAVTPLPFLNNIATVAAQVAFDRLSLNELFAADRFEREKLRETFDWQSVLPLYLRSPSVTLSKSYANPNPAHEQR